MQLHLFARYRSSSRGAEAARSSELASDPSCGPGLLRWVLFGDTLCFYPCRLWCQEVHFYNGLRKKLVAKALGGALGGRGDDEAELWGASFAPCPPQPVAGRGLHLTGSDFGLCTSEPQCWDHLGSSKAKPGYQSTMQLWWECIPLSWWRYTSAQLKGWFLFF